MWIAAALWCVGGAGCVALDMRVGVAHCELRRFWSGDSFCVVLWYTILVSPGSIPILWIGSWLAVCSLRVRSVSQGRMFNAFKQLEDQVRWRNSHDWNTCCGLVSLERFWWLRCWKGLKNVERVRGEWTGNWLVPCILEMVWAVSKCGYVEAVWFGVLLLGCCGSGSAVSWLAVQCFYVCIFCG